MEYILRLFKTDNSHAAVVSSPYLSMWTERFYYLWHSCVRVFSLQTQCLVRYICTYFSHLCTIMMLSNKKLLNLCTFQEESLPITMKWERLHIMLTESQLKLVFWFGSYCNNWCYCATQIFLLYQTPLTSLYFLESIQKPISYPGKFRAKIL